MAAVLAATLLLTACGGSGDDGPDKIVGAGDDSPESSAPASETPAEDAPEFDFPDDLTVEIDADTTGDEAEAEVLQDHGYAVSARLLGLAKGDPELAQINTYVAGESFVSLADGIESLKGQGLTITGTTHFYDREVTLRNDKAATVTYCEDQRKAFNKEIESGEVHETEPSDDSFHRITAVMEKSGDGVWQMTKDQSTEGDASCLL